MPEQEKILARIQEALKVRAPSPGHGPVHPRPGPGPPSKNARAWLPAVGESFAERIALFQRNTLELKAEFHLVENRDQLSNSLLKLRDAEGWKRVASHAGELTDEACRMLGLPVCRTDRTYEVGALEASDAGITECDALVAQTGSVLVTSRSAGGRALSVLPPHHVVLARRPELLARGPAHLLPPHHVVLARREQLLADLPEAFALLKQKYPGNYPSFISFITGPSRTGDIERVLVLGAHGPKKLTILCV